MMTNAYIIVLDSLVSDGFFDENTDKENRLVTIGNASANSAKFREIRPRMYIEDLL